MSLVVSEAVPAGGRPAARQRAVAAGLAAIFLAFHVPYRPSTLEDLDSINFALGVRQFDVAQHQPHPPGYPVYVFAAKAATGLAGSELAALSAISIVSGTLGVLAIAGLFLRLEPAAPRSSWITATALATAAPLYWFSAARPLSDTMGLAAALGIQAMTLSVSADPALAAVGFCAGLAAGIRSQVVWLTVPLLAFQLFQSGSRTAFSRGSRLVTAGLAYGCGVLIWAVPLVALSGGPAAYLRALSNQGTEDFTGVRMLLTSPGVRELVNASYYTFVAPWAAWWIAVPVLLLSGLGIIVLLRSGRRTALLLAVAFGPYSAFHMVFQETFTSRYALPLVIPIAYCAAVGVRALPRRSGLLAAAVIAAVSAHIGGTSLAAYSRARAPAFRLLDDMRTAAAGLNAPPVLALDRREEFDLRRPIRWVGDRMPVIDRKLPAPPQHEWLELVKYWNAGGRAPVWLVVDPMRHAVDLIGRGAGAEPARYRWPLPYPVLLSGVRPNEMDWYRIGRPEWYAGEGWALTPEIAGVSAVDRRGLSSGAIEAWIAKEALPGTLAVGGRNFDPAAKPRLEVSVNGRLLDQAVVEPGFFLRFVPLRAAPESSADFASVTIRTVPPSAVGIEQFDASSTRPVFGYGSGWYESEFSPQNGLRWRWLSERGELRVRAPPGASALTVHLEGESPRKYFSRGSRLTARAGEHPVLDRVLTSDFSLDMTVPAAPGRDAETTVTLETDQVFIPAARRLRPSADRRHLGLRIFKCQVRVGS